MYIKVVKNFSSTSLLAFIVAIGLLYIQPVHASALATLPPPSSGDTFSMQFGFDVNKVQFGDFDGDGILDVVAKSEYLYDSTGAPLPTSTLKVEARRNNNDGTSTKLWDKDTGINVSMAYGPNEMPVLSWDFDNDGKWEVYYQYRLCDSQSVGCTAGTVDTHFRHRIVDGATGNVLADSRTPQNWNLSGNSQKSMAAVGYYQGIPRIIQNIDSEWVWMLQTYSSTSPGGTFSLNQLWDSGLPSGRAAHDMIRVLDVDGDGDDEILLGCLVLNANGTVRYDVEDAITARCGGTDQVLVGRLDANNPDKLVVITGDMRNDRVIAYHADNQGTDPVMWARNMGSEFSIFTHFHTGWVRAYENGGGELLVIDRNDPNWAHMDTTTGNILSKGTGTTGRPSCSGRPMKWNAGDSDDCSGKSGRPGRIDVGGPGCEESLDVSGRTLNVQFNTSCPASEPSRWANRSYRLDAAAVSSGYSSYWLGAAVVGPTGPAVTITSPIDGSSLSSPIAVSSGQNVSLTASAVDQDGANIASSGTWSYSSVNAGTTVPGFATGPTASVSFSTADYYAVTFSATDSNGLSGNDTKYYIFGSPAPVCGNGILETGEDCEGSNYNGVTCGSYGFTAGSLSCNSCVIDSSACYNAPTGGGSCVPNGTIASPRGPAPAPGSTAIVVDDAGSGFSQTGTWVNSAYVNPYNGSSRYSLVTDATASTATFSFTIGASGSYQVAAWWTAGEGRIPDARYIIVSDSGTTEVRVNQQQQGGQWNDLGTYPFSTGTYTVTVDENTTSSSTGSACMDSVGVDAVYISGGGTSSACNHNNIAESGEACDGTDLKGATCSSLGYTSGTPTCTNSCTINSGSCFNTGTSSCSGGIAGLGGDHIPDLNSDGCVNASDLSVLLGQWGETSTPGTGTHPPAGSGSTGPTCDTNGTACSPSGTTNVNCCSNFCTSTGVCGTATPGTTADTTYPTISSLSITAGSAVVSWIVQDQGGSHLDHIELWRAQDSGGSPSGWQEVSAQRVTISSQNIDQHTATIIDVPPSGTWWYGIHVWDQAGNCTTESGTSCGGSTASGQAISGRTNYGSTKITQSSGGGCSVTFPVGESHRFNAMTNDPDGDDIFYTFTWGDGSSHRQPASGYVSSGTQVYQDKAYISAGTYSAQVTATDNQGNQSPASNIITICVN